jgi:DNA mismatch endonuclease (patch repair protein)
VVPKTRMEWWVDKINRNVNNDNKAIASLKKDGWKIITIWECNLKPNTVESTLKSLLKSLS